MSSATISLSILKVKKITFTCVIYKEKALTGFFPAICKALTGASSHIKLCTRPLWDEPGAVKKKNR